MGMIMELVLPPALVGAVPPDRLAALQNPQLLLNRDAMARLQQALQTLGPPGRALFEQLIVAMRESLATAITGLFLVGCGLMLLGLLATLFLPEMPLRPRRGRGASETAPPLSPPRQTPPARGSGWAESPAGHP